MTPLKILPVLVAIAACSPEPRSTTYFAAHKIEAETVVDRCQIGSQRGAECANAQAALAAIARDDRMAGFRKGF